LTSEGLHTASPEVLAMLKALSADVGPMHSGKRLNVVYQVLPAELQVAEEVAQVFAAGEVSHCTRVL
jgi:hypothetical protein